MNDETGWGGKKDPDQIHAEIDRTRAEVGRTIDEIKERLSPGNIKQRLQEATREKAKYFLTTAGAKTKEWGCLAAERVRNRPLPLMLIGAGIGAGIHYPLPVHLQGAFKHLGYKAGDFPIAETLGRERIVLCGERDGQRINGFDLGNSPLEFTEGAVRGKTLVMATTNGTPMFNRVKPSSFVCVACINNAQAVSRALARPGADVAIVCSGKLGRFSLEDAVGAGMLVSYLSEIAPDADLTDGALNALLLYRKFCKNLPRAMKSGEHGRYLASLGYKADLEYAARENITATVPLLREGRIAKLTEEAGTIA